MASERRGQVVQLAELLGIEFERGIGTAELMGLCLTEVEGRGEGWGQEPEETAEVESEVESDAPPKGFREALRSAPEPAVRSRAGGNGARKLREANERFHQELGAIEQLRRVERAEPSEATETQEVAPAVSFTRRQRRAERKAS